MKKIIITSACLFVVFFATAQTGKLVSESVAANTKAEDPHNPLVNGIPYSQYKAQQNAIKARQQQEEQAVTATAPKLQSITVIGTPGDLKAASASQKLTATTDVPTAKPVVSTNAAPVKPIFNGTLSSGANSQLSAPVDMNANAAAQIPEVKQSQEAQKIEAEIPASVAPAKVKIPELPKQGGNN